MTEQRGPRDGQDILLREVLVTKELLGRQHPRYPFKSKGRLKTARPLNYTAKSEIYLTGVTENKNQGYWKTKRVVGWAEEKWKQRTYKKGWRSMPKPSWWKGSLATVHIQPKSFAGCSSVDSLSLSQTGWMHGTQQQNKGRWHLEMEISGEQHWTELDWLYHSVMPYLYTKGRFALTEHIWGCHATAVVLWEKGNDGVEVGLVDRRGFKFQFLNTRKQGIVWSQSFSEEIGCSFSVLRPPSPKP